MKAANFTLALFFVIILNTFAFAQPIEKDTVVFRIETRDGNEFVGKIISENSEKIIT